MLRFDIDSLVSATALSKAPGKYLARCKEKPLLILRNNEVEGVLVSAETYRELLEAYELVQDMRLAREVFEQPTENPEDKDVFQIMQEIEAQDDVHG
ncbi:MAG TPA: type II toxin-antitoxin system Phd/YefM family antitoxin [Syntrophothermus lipocalidus]|nr:type II toxin-antitoxin system Phd/YefM family antitoxin [Syntrophothermus lipocalidus]